MEKDLSYKEEIIDSFNQSLPEKELKQMSPLVLAWVGDSVYSNYVRRYLIIKKKGKINDLHNKSVDFVKAETQSKVIQDLIKKGLTEEEIRYVKRGRNKQSHNPPKNSNPIDYHYSTGFETLLGWLELSGQKKRLKELCSIIIEKIENLET